ncbi:prenylcysteine oxidase 1-like isoform X2 [Argopecten irradians]
MREQFGSEAVIDLYEKNAIGGRLATININSRDYESGGSIIHPDNLYMVNFTNILGLEKRERSSGQTMGIFDGEEMVLTTSPYTVVTLAKMFWRYGMDIYNLQKWVSSDLLVKFKRIYKTQDAGFAYTNIPELLAAMDPSFANYLKKSILMVMREEGFHEAMIHELVLGAMRTNYGQGLEIPGFVGAISMAGVEPGLWSVKGGNKKVPQNIVKHSKVNVIPAEVKMVEFLEDEPFLYEVYYKEKNGEAKTKRYDMVVIATPLHDGISDIKFEGFQQDIHNFPQQYHKTVATFVHGTLNSTYFGVDNPIDMTNEVFTCNMNLLMNSFGQHLPVDYSSTSDKVPPIDGNIVGKIFSNRELTQEEVKLYFKSIEEIQTVSWMAYPEYNFKKTDDLPPFLLNERLYYVNAIELAASAMEMEAIAGRNIALLAYNHWYDKLDKIDEKYMDPSQMSSSETGDL